MYLFAQISLQERLLYWFVARVLIADDERLFAAALELILGSDERIEVVGTAFDGKQAVELTLELAPDVVLMDLSRRGCSCSPAQPTPPTSRGRAPSACTGT